MWGIVTNGKDMMDTRGEDRSCGPRELSASTERRVLYLLKQVCSKHQDFCVWTKALNCREVPNPFLEVL